MQLYAFDKNINPLGPIENITGLSWEEKFTDAGTFELWCSLNEENAAILQEDNIVWPGGDTAGIVEYFHKEKSEDGILSFHVKGRLTVAYLDYRSVYPRLIITDAPSGIIVGLVDSNLVSPEDPERVIPGVEIDPNQEIYGSQLSYQRLGSTVLLEASTLAESHGLGFSMKFLPEAKKHRFCVTQRTDRTVNQALVHPVVFESDLNDIISASYSENKSEFKNCAYVAGEGEGSDRVIVQTDLNTTPASGVDRRELFVDARDIQSESEDGSTMTQAEYLSALSLRGIQNFEDYKLIKEFSATMKTFGESALELGKDYFLGDIVTVYDRDLQVSVDAQISAVRDSYGESGVRSRTITFGFGQPTLVTKLKRRIMH